MFIFRAIFGSFASNVREINRRYRTPTIAMTPFVRICLISLRVYLLVLVGLMLYKFVLTVKG